MLDTTRIRQIGVGQHGRKNDAIDAEAIAMALESGRVPLAHVLSPARRALRAKLSVRGELVEMRAQYVTIIRGLARAAGVLLADVRASTRSWRSSSGATGWPDARADGTTGRDAQGRPGADRARRRRAGADGQGATRSSRCARPRRGSALIVAATFVSVIDEAKRFRNAHAVSAYLGLVPGENTTGGKRGWAASPNKATPTLARCSCSRPGRSCVRATPTTR